MRYRAIRCEDCGKVTEMSLDVPETCSCGGRNMYGWAIEEKDYRCFSIEKSVKELFADDQTNETINP